MQLRPLGPRALLVEVADAREAAALATWARDRLAAEEIVPAARTVLLDGVDPAEAEALLAGWSAAIEVAEGELVELPTTYDGPDLARVAELWSCSVEEVVARHTSVSFTSAFCGFAPGFAYLTGLPAGWRVPRLDSPRSRVPAGSVALAGEWCGVYPSPSPGGWLLLGRLPASAAARLWDPARSQPALLAPGTRVRFVAGSGNDR
ncbi:5-oxoprolinase subunit B family protein [Nocardioides sp.]|uniref:5-oxoprolinase subunit B family protein n=1 Tax=Nocardioides sp. TaxID=35761 RepID=UPI0039E58A0A